MLTRVTTSVLLNTFLLLFGPAFSACASLYSHRQDLFGSRIGTALGTDQHFDIPSAVSSAYSKFSEDETFL